MADELFGLIARMKAALPEFVSGDAMMGAYFDAVAPEIQLMQDEAQAAPLQLWPDTVTTGIARLEALYGLPSNTALTLAERRRLVLIKILAMRTVTVQVMRDLIAELSGDRAVISYYPRQFEAWIKMVVDYGRPAYLGALQEAIDYHLPAHIQPHYILYGLLTWRGLETSGATWSTLPAVTWAALPLENRGVHRLLWNELQQNMYRYGELTWAALANTGTAWANLATFDVAELEGAKWR